MYLSLKFLVHNYGRAFTVASGTPMSNQYSRNGFLCVVSGPSGSGKTTLCQSVCDAGLARYSISCTTRKPRPGEQDGDHYHFLSEEAFLEKAMKGEFLEYARVHGNLYGTLKSEVTRHILDGHDVVMDIDVQGAALIRQTPDSVIQQSLVDIFILLPSVEELERRLRGRGTEEKQAFDLRMKNSLEEMRQWASYQYTILSGTREEDLERFQHILMAERHRSDRILDHAGGDLLREDQGELSL